MSHPSGLKKVTMAGSGLALLGFLLVHLGGSALLVKGAAPFNQFSAFLHRSGPLSLIAEFALALLFLVHLFSSVLVSLEKKKLQTQSTAAPGTPEPTTVFGRSMAATGIIILVFVPVHVWKFRFGKAPELGGSWSLVMGEFADPIAVAWYLVATIALGMHLSHGLASGARTLGLFGPDRRDLLEKFGILVAWAIAIGFGCLPIWAFIRNQSF